MFMVWMKKVRSWLHIINLDVDGTDKNYSYSHHAFCTKHLIFHTSFKVFLLFKKSFSFECYFSIYLFSFMQYSTSFPSTNFDVRLPPKKERKHYHTFLHLFPITEDRIWFIVILATLSHFFFSIVHPGFCFFIIRTVFHILFFLGGACSLMVSDFVRDIGKTSSSYDQDHYVGFRTNVHGKGSNLATFYTTYAYMIRSDNLSRKKKKTVNAKLKRDGIRQAILFWIHHCYYGCSICVGSNR